MSNSSNSSSSLKNNILSYDSRVPLYMRYFNEILTNNPNELTSNEVDYFITQKQQNLKKSLMISCISGFIVNRFILSRSIKRFSTRLLASFSITGVAFPITIGYYNNHTRNQFLYNPDFPLAKKTRSIAYYTEPTCRLIQNYQQLGYNNFDDVELPKVIQEIILSGVFNHEEINQHQQNTNTNQQNEPYHQQVDPSFELDNSTQNFQNDTDDFQSFNDDYQQEPKLQQPKEPYFYIRDDPYNPGAKVKVRVNEYGDEEIIEEI